MTGRARSYGNQNAAHRAIDTPPKFFDDYPDALHARAIRFIETQCRAYKGHTFGELLRLAAYQCEWLESVFASSDVITGSVLSLGRGNGKTSFAGAVATWALFDPAVADTFGGQPVIPVVAPKLQQAVDGVYGAATHYVRANEELAKRTRPYNANGNQRLVVEYNRGGYMLPLAANPHTLQGLDPSICILDEVGFMPMAVWTALRLGQGKRPRNLTLGLGTKGYDRTDNILDYLLRVGNAPGLLIVNYETPPGYPIDDPEGWRLANPALVEGFLSEDEIRLNLADTPEPEFRRFRLNQTVASTTSWLGIEGAMRWDENTDNARAFDPELPTWLGVDKSDKGDCSAIAILQQCPDIDAWYVEVEIFDPAHSGRVIDHRAIRDRISQLCETMNVEAVGYDARYFVEGAQDLADSGHPMIEVQQTAKHLSGTFAHFYQLVVSNRLLHKGDERFRAHVLSAVRTPTGMLAKDKTVVGAHIDAAVATAIALYVAGAVENEEYNPEHYWIA